MTKEFSFNCDFGGQKANFKFYIGTPKDDQHPLHFQADWLSKERGGTVPSEIMDALSKLQDLAKKNGVSFENLCVYALGAAQEDKNKEEDDNDTDTTSND